MSEEFKQALREKTPKRMRELAQLNCFASFKVKNFLDSKFGQNNYTIIAIGRSISSITEFMKHKIAGSVAISCCQYPCLRQ